MTPMRQGLLCYATMLFNCLLRGIMLIINRPLVGLYSDEEHHEVIIKRQTKDDKNKETSKNYVSVPIGSTVGIWVYGESWTHGTIEGKADQNHHDRSHHICITKTGRLATQNGQHVSATQISAEQYLWHHPQKHTKTDPLENILTQLEKQPDASNNYNNINNGTFIKNPKHEH